MTSKEKLQQFVTGLLTNEHDREMTVHSRQDTDERRVMLAADSEDVASAPVKKLGVLSDQNGELLIRVFHNDPEQCYQLFLVGTNDIKTHHLLVSFTQSFKYFLSNETGQVDIPFSAGINPMEEPPRIASPVDELQVDKQNLEKSFRTKTSRGIQCQLEWNQDTDKLEIILGKIPQELSYSRLIVLTDTDHQDRLIPVRNSRAQVSLDKIHTRDMTLRFYN